MLTLRILIVLVLVASCLLSSHTTAQTMTGIPVIPNGLTPKQQLAAMRSIYADLKQEYLQCQVSYQNQMTTLCRPIGGIFQDFNATQRNLVLQKANSIYEHCLSILLWIWSYQGAFAQQAGRLGLDGRIDPASNPARVLTQQQILNGAFSADEHEYSADDYGYYGFSTGIPDNSPGDLPGGPSGGSFGGPAGGSPGGAAFDILGGWAAMEDAVRMGSARRNDDD